MLLEKQEERVELRTQEVQRALIQEAYQTGNQWDFLASDIQTSKGNLGPNMLLVNGRNKRRSILPLKVNNKLVSIIVERVTAIRLL